MTFGGMGEAHPSKGHIVILTKIYLTYPTLLRGYP